MEKYDAPTLTPLGSFADVTMGTDGYSPDFVSTKRSYNA